MGELVSTYTKQSIYKHKHGDTLDLSGELTVSGESVEDITLWTAACEVRDADYNLVEQLSFEWLSSETNMCRIKSQQDTSSWPIGRLFFDVQFTSTSGDIISTPTVTLIVERDITL